MIRILILCTGNSCRSQMAEGFLRNFDENLYVRSAGTNPSDTVHPKAILVMADEGIDLSNATPENVNLYQDKEWDYVITVCGHAKETCPVFLGRVKHKIHIGFEDPAEATGSESEILEVFIRIRNEIKNDFKSFYEKNIVNQKN